MAKAKTVLVKRKFIDKEPFEVRVMAEAEGWLMVRRFNCAAFAVHKSDTRPTPQPTRAE